MKRCVYTALVAILLAAQSWAQPFGIGERTITLINVADGNRSVPINIYYPATSSGVNAPVATASGLFPVVAFGHGFVMPTSAYGPLWQSLVPEGFVVALPNTETGVGLSHAQFARDLNFTLQAVQALHLDANDPFFGKLDTLLGAVGGHSMGGGSSLLAAALSGTKATCVFNYAAAETTPSAIAAASGISIPALLLAGDKDCVAPISGHQQPMYNALASPAKAIVVLQGGNHCQFASSNVLCEFGENSCGGVATITPAQQQAKSISYVLPFLKWQLRNDQSAKSALLQLLNAPTDATVQHTMNTANVGKLTPATLKLTPNPAHSQLSISSNEPIRGVEIFDAVGRRVLTATKAHGIDIVACVPGIYTVVVRTAFGQHALPLTISR